LCAPLWTFCAEVPISQLLTHAERAEAYRANVLCDADRDDTEFGYRFLDEEARATGEPMAWAHRSTTIWSPVTSLQEYP
jgi:hypothetical protein